MKKIVLILAVLSAFSCSEKEPQPCNCGIVANDGIDGNCHWIEIRNNCSGNKKIFCIDEDKWMNAHPGTEFCITNYNSW
jgi:hypothetical protein